MCIRDRCLGLVLALPRRLAVGRGFWGKLPFELYAGAVVLLGVGVFEAAGYLTYAALDDSIPDVLRTLFFVNQTDSETLAFALLFLLFWLCAFVLFQAGASLGMSLRDGFGRYLLCQMCIRDSAGAYARLHPRRALCQHRPRLQQRHRHQAGHEAG